MEIEELQAKLNYKRSQLQNSTNEETRNDILLQIKKIELRLEIAQIQKKISDLN